MHTWTSILLPKEFHWVCRRFNSIAILVSFNKLKTETLYFFSLALLIARFPILFCSLTCCHVSVHFTNSSHIPFDCSLVVFILSFDCRRFNQTRNDWMKTIIGPANKVTWKCWWKLETFSFKNCQNKEKFDLLFDDFHWNCVGLSYENKLCTENKNESFTWTVANKRQKYCRSINS